MATPKIQIAPERVAEGKRLYETTMTTIADIAALMGVSRRTLENRRQEPGEGGKDFGKEVRAKHAWH